MSKLRALIESQLVDRGDGTVLDTKTNLVWEKVTSDLTYTWNEANNYCKKLNLAGYNDWRLPTIKELRTLLKNKNPNIDNIFECKADYYWTGSLCVFLYATHAWCVSFKDAKDCGMIREGIKFVRAVRNNTQD